MSIFSRRNGRSPLFAFVAVAAVVGGSRSAHAAPPVPQIVTIPSPSLATRIASGGPLALMPR